MQLLQGPARGQLQTGRSGSHRRTCRDDRACDVSSDPVRWYVVPVPVRDVGTSVAGLRSVVREPSAREVLASLTLFYLIEVEELVDFYFYILRAGPWWCWTEKEQAGKADKPWLPWNQKWQRWLGSDLKSIIAPERGQDGISLSWQPHKKSGNPASRKMRRLILLLCSLWTVHIADGRFRH